MAVLHADSRSAVRLRRGAWWRYGVELVVVTVALVIVVRTWLVMGIVVPVEIAASSMAPTLRGPHLTADCPACGTRFAFDATFPSMLRPAQGRGVCPNCRRPNVDIGQEPPVRGDRVWVDRTAWLLRPPARWEPAVFRCPDRPSALCIKRIVGLPGESVQIQGGDVYINGQIARKGLAEIGSLAIPVYDADRPAARAEASRFVPLRSVTAWRREDRWIARLPPAAGGRTIQPSGGRTIQPAGERADWLAYRHADGRPIDDDYGYNQGLTRRLADVPDIGLVVRIREPRRVGREAGYLWLRARTPGGEFRAALQIDAPGARLWHDGQLVRERRTGEPAVTQGHSARLELWVVDSRVLVGRDGQPLLVYPFVPRTIEGRPTLPALALGVQNIAIDVDHLSVWRDLHYTDAGPGGGRVGSARPFCLAVNEYFVLGDNSPISLDSRNADVGPVPSRMLVGRPLAIALQR